MKNKNTVTLIEVLVLISIITILGALLIPTIDRAVKKSKVIQENRHQQEEVQKPGRFQIGDIVYVDGMDVTGKINQIWGTIATGNTTIDLIVKGTNGVPHIIEKVSIVLLKKVQIAESWR